MVISRNLTVNRQLRCGRAGVAAFGALFAVVCGLGPARAASADAVITPGDFVIAVDGMPSSSSSYPTGEKPSYLIDGSANTKYFNWGGDSTGFIITPGASSTVQSFVLTTANDAKERDPASYQLFGTNDTITSADNSDGLAEAWSLIDSGSIAMPDARKTAASPINLTNGAAYASYKMFFPTLKGPSQQFMQLAEAQFYTGSDATGAAIFSSSDPILAIGNPVSNSDYPSTESPAHGIDGSAASKYYNEAGAGSGLIVTPSAGPSIVTSMELIAAGDAPGRSPTSFEIYGTNDSILSADNSDGTAEAWTFIASDAVSLTPGGTDTISFANTDQFASYKILFPTNGGDDDFQIANVQLEGTVIPEPASLALVGMGAVCILKRRRREAEAAK